ncbi:MAG TPA: hypothetical protein VGJ84_03960 [Polyangiaceae bacterium]
MPLTFECTVRPGFGKKKCVCLFAVLIGMAAVFGAERARAESSASFNITWNAPAECPLREQFVSDVRRLLQVPDMGQLKVEASVDVEQIAERRWRLKLQTRAASFSGERVVEGESCAAVLSAGAVVLALLIAPTVSADALLPEIQKTEEPARPPGIARKPTRPVQPAQPGRKTIARAGFSVTAAIAGGAQPGLGFGWGPGVNLAVERWYFATYFFDFPVRRRSLSGGATVELSLYRAQGVACFEITRFGRLASRTCAGGALDAGRGQSLGIFEPASDTAIWWSLLGGFTLEWSATSQGSVTGGVCALVPLARPNYTVEGRGTVFEPKALGIQATLGGVVYF